MLNKMKVSLTILVLSLWISNPAQSSAFIECDILATVVNIPLVTKALDKHRTVQIRIDTTQPYVNNGDYDCHFDSMERTVLVESTSIGLLSTIKVKDQLRLKYSFSSAMGEVGVVESEAWFVVSVEK